MARAKSTPKKRTSSKKSRKSRGKNSKFLGTFNSYGMQPLSEFVNNGDTFIDKESTAKNKANTFSAQGKVTKKRGKTSGQFYDTPRTNVFKGG